MKYLVVVNKKFIVSVESTSNGGAEHVVLDRFEGVYGAQAFCGSGLRTDTFTRFLAECDTISMDELAEMMDKHAEAKRRAIEAENVLAEASDAYDRAKGAYAKASDEWVEACKAIGI